jgi:hypothetical protein
MRITVRLDESLVREAKKRAAESGKTLAAVIEDALREALSRPPRAQRSTLKFTTFAGHGLRPGVDLDRSADLLEIMESNDDAH